MAVRLLPDGTIEFDSVSDAVEYRKLMAAAAANGAKPDNVTNPKQPPRMEAIEGFLKELAGNQLAIMSAIFDSKGPVTTEEIAAKSGLGAGSIGPVMRHLLETLDKRGLKRSAIMAKEKYRRDSDGKLSTRYVPKESTHEIWRRVMGQK
jgi:hypothetical protein